ncbi:MAG TPA: hypothetical protein VHQ86_05575, partial [Candidatus Saccharimonadia bacterium]|nr:hypothetical protein [Candidatus Saccharimonadia bacterium]
MVLATALQIITAAFGVGILVRPAATDAAQSVPYMVNFQGRLTDNSGNALSDGLYNIKFRLWTLASGGSNQWEADRVMGASDYRVQVTNGLFNIQFGDTTLGDPAITPSLFNTGAGTLYLEVELPTPASATCATNGCAVFTEGAMTPRQPLASSPYAINSDALDGLDSGAFGQIAATNTFTGANLFAPTTASTVALTVKATTAGSTNALEVFDSGGTRQAFFDATGALTLAQAISAPAATNTINNLVINAGALSGVTGYNQASGNFVQSGAGTFATGSGGVSLGGDTTIVAGKSLILPSGTGTIQQTFSAAVAGNAQSLSFTNTNAGAGITMQGINLATANATATSGGTNVLNVINFPAGTALLASDNTNGLNFASATGYTNFIKTPTTVLTSAGAFTGVPSITVTTTTATALVANTVTSGIAVSDTGLTTGSGLTAGGANTTSGSGVIYSAASNTLSTGSALSVTTGGAAITAAYTGSLININVGRTHAAATAITDTGNYLNLSRSLTNTNAGGSFSVSGALANLQSNCTQTAGTCGDSSTILNLNQQYASASGTVLNVQGAGTGNLANLDASNTSANGVAIDVQSSGTGQYVLKLTSNNAATNVLFARADGHVGIGNAAPSTALDVTGTINGTGFSASGTAGQSSTVSCSANQAVTAAVFTSGLLTTAPSCSTISGTGAATSLNNLTTTSINQSLLSNADNTLDLGSASDVWKNVFTSNVDAGTTTTTLTIGTAATTTAVTVGRSGLAVSLPGGLTTSGGNISAGAGTISGAVINATTKFQANGTDGTASTCGAGAALTGATFSEGILTAAGSCTTFQAAGSYIVQAPAGTANTITAASGAQALIIKGTNGTATHLLDIYNTAVSPVLTSYFDQNGALTTTAAITAPTSSNTINNLVVNNGALSAVTGYTQASGSASITSANTSGNVLSVADTSLNTTGGNLASLTFTNANATSTATTISGLSITPTGTTNSNSNVNTLNAIVFPNVTPVTNNAFYGLSFGTGYSDILRLTSGTSIINGSGQINGAQIQSSTVANGSLANSSVTVSPGTNLSGGGTVALGGTITLNTIANPSFATSVTSPSFTGTGAVSVTSAGGAALTLDSASANLILGTTTTAIQKAAAALAIDLATAGTSTLTIKNSNGANVANLAVTGNIDAGSGKQFTVGGTQISSANLSNDANITKQGNTFNGTSQLVQTNGSGQLPALSGTNLTNLNPTNLATGSGAVTLASTTSALTLTSGSGTIILGSSILQRTAASATLDISNAGTSTLSVLNSNGANVANLSVDGGIGIGTGQVYNVGGTNGATVAACTSGQYQASQAALGGIITAGTCTTADLQNAYTNSTSPATITLADAKNLVFSAPDTTTDPSVLINLQCATCSASGGRFAVQDSGTDVFTVSPNGPITVAPVSGQNFAITQAGSSGTRVTASGVPTVDQVNIDNTSTTGVATAGVNGLSVNYKGSTSAIAAGIEAAGMRVDFAPSTVNPTSGTNVWSGLRIVAAATGATSNNTEYGLKLEGPSSPGAGTEIANEIATGWDIGVDVQSGGLQLATMADPTTPAANNLRVYAKLTAGRVMLRAKTPTGVSYALQPSLFEQYITYVGPGNGATPITNLSAFGASWTESTPAQ